MLRSLRLVSLLLILLSYHFAAFSQENAVVYPDSVDQRVRYEIVIEMPKAYLSGLMIMYKPEEGRVDASVINEFGISLMDFSYNEKKDKIKIHSITDKLNKWYIKRTLSNDFKNILKAMHSGSCEYLNSKRKIKYSFQLANETE
jgi:hypothetical protein